MGSRRRTLLFNLATYAVLLITLCVVIFYALVGFGVVGGMGSAGGGETAVLPTATPPGPEPTETSIPTWTPTPTPTETPIPSPTNTRTPTLTPSITPTPLPTFTFPPTQTPTPRATRSPWPFDCRAELRRPEYDHWSGVAGHLEDLDGNPVPGYYVVVKGPVDVPAVRAGEDPVKNRIYGNEAAWEQVFNPTAYQAMEIRVQVCRPNRDPNKPCEAISNEVVVNLGGYASGSLGYVTCVLNWENWP